MLPIPAHQTVPFSSPPLWIPGTQWWSRQNSPPASTGPPPCPAAAAASIALPSADGMTANVRQMTSEWRGEGGSDGDDEPCQSERGSY